MDILMILVCSTILFVLGYIWGSCADNAEEPNEEAPDAQV